MRYATVGFLVGLLVSLALVAYGVFVWIDLAAGGTIHQIVTQIVPPLTASFAGAFAAYQFTVRKESTVAKKTQISSGNFALFRLHQMYTIVKTFQRDFVDPTRADPNRWAKMNSPPPGMIERVRFNFDELSFFLDHPKPSSPAAQVLSDLLFLETQFLVAIDLIDMRANIVMKEVLPAIHDIVPQAQCPSDIENRHTYVRNRLLSLTEELVKRIDDMAKEIELTYEKMREALEFLHPNGSFLTLKFGDLNLTPPVCNAGS